MKRIIIDHTKVTKEILEIIMKDYPNGYNDNDVIKFKNHRNELIEALEIKLNDDIYLVKVGTKLSNVINQHLDTDQEINLEDLE